ncbi:hypothetical protein [Endozoicomonas acroporae]|uniref:hypothetical protein n=1 Tax=Endozoicomonas acroporae TaxID=1701104 RepID=UPI003D79C7C3
MDIKNVINKRKKTIKELVKDNFQQLNELKESGYTYKDLLFAFNKVTGLNAEFITFREYMIRLRKNREEK